MAVKQHDTMRDFDAAAVAHYEASNWIYYYQKRWRELLGASIGMLRSGFGLSLAQSVRAAYWIMRAEMAAAPRDNNIELAEAYMRRFYRLVKRLQKEPFSPRKVAALDVRWWVTHRELATQQIADKKPLEDALAAYYVALYQTNIEAVREAARYRTLAMTYSDQWVGQGRASNDPLLPQIEQALVKAYTALAKAVGGKQRAVGRRRGESSG